MKSPLFYLRLLVILFFGFSALNVVAKPCNGDISVKHKYADGTIVELYYGHGGWLCGLFSTPIDISMFLAPGDSVLVSQIIPDMTCTGFEDLEIRGASLADSANAYSPIMHSHCSGENALKIAQSGSYFIFQVSGAGCVRLFIQMDPIPTPVGMRFNKLLGDYFDYSYWQPDITPEDTCSGPCYTWYLLDGQSIWMQAVANELAQEGGNVVVRYAPVGDSLDFGSPFNIVLMIGFEGFRFSEDGTYLLSVEGPLFTSSAHAYVRVSHSPSPRLDMSLTVQRLDGTTEEVAYLQPVSPTPSFTVVLDPGDSLRIYHHEITEPCTSVRLKVYQSPDWGPASPNEQQLIGDTQSTSAGVLLATPGSYLLVQGSDCGIWGSRSYVTINSPDPQLDIVISVQHDDGAEEELLHSDTPLDTVPHLIAPMESGDSIRVYYEESGWAGYMAIRIFRSGSSADATLNDEELTANMSGVQNFLFSGNANYLIRFNGGNLYPAQHVHLRIVDAAFWGIDLQVDLLQATGTSLPLTYAEAGGPMAYTTVSLSPEGSIMVSGIVNQSLCTDLTLKAFRADVGTATTNDPVFLDSPLPASGLTFRETGSLLLTLEDTCGTITASAHVTATASFSTAISSQDRTQFNARYVNDVLFVDSDAGGALQVRNAAGQLVYETQIAEGTVQHTIPFIGQGNGVYIATLLGTSHVDVFRFAVY